MATAIHIERVPPPDLHLPLSPNTVNVRIIDTTTSMLCKADYFLSPTIGNLHELYCNAFAFLVENPRTGQKLVFDLGVRKDWENLATPMVERLLAQGFRINVEKGVSEILQEEHVALEDIDAIIWSHWHFDHIGDPSTFPETTSLVVGPGTLAAKLPPWPENLASTLTASDIRGREVREISSAEFTLKIGRFRALDYFNDGSFYLLDVPGHAIGHICGLARTTENSFILMGADTCHHGGQYRPSPYVPLPESIKPHPRGDSVTAGPNETCPCSIFEELHPNPAEYRTQQFYSIRVREDGGSVAFNVQDAKDSIAGLQEFDAADNVLVVCAHDASLKGIIDVFPQYANAWKDGEWKEKGRWRFLGDWEIPDHKV
ncbi:conserved hypothetical protein [Talaromyces stipitatus ATCC 10500]|uniref:Metallo-beta-lactamase domain-containing protein n=1 Tax=Talaromyces stipitatus (strain ATCC 10500 / CBS 375.48 / QM 6759 / NRRL 1006) TaxID=441959 RepID=B8MKY2_TALSN|nr:uncharacterized protein TSTA_048390 [Talaromyces stipitatus ATCC 10500]EED15398.1 conserved hypothetical protein [Talaromyces stipitatus ATCC 10500]